MPRIPDIVHSNFSLFRLRKTGKPIRTSLLLTVYVLFRLEYLFPCFYFRIGINPVLNSISTCHDYHGLHAVSFFFHRVQINCRQKIAGIHLPSLFYMCLKSFSIQSDCIKTDM